MSAPAQRSFAGGELAPACYARTDLVKYATGLRTCRNLVVQRHGGAANRAGTQYIATVKYPTRTVRLKEFVLDSTDIADTYLMEVGHQYIRFYQAAARIVTSGVAAWANATSYTVGDLVTSGGVTFYCTSAHVSAAGTDHPGVDASWLTRWYAQTGTIYEIPTPYQETDLSALQFSQTGDVVTITHRNYAVRELKRFGHTRWTLSAVAFGPSIAAPTNVAAAGGAAGTIRYWAVTAVKQGSLEESLAGIYSAINIVPAAGTPTAISWNSVPGAISYNVYRSTDGQTYGLITSAGGNPIAATDTAWTDTDETATSTIADVWAAAAGQLRNPLAAISPTVRAYDGKYTVKLQVTLTGGGDGSGGLIGDPTQTMGRFSVYYARDGEPRVLAATSDIFVVEGAAVSGPLAASLTIDVPDNGYAALVIDVVPEVLPTVTGPTCSMNVNTTVAPNDRVTWTGGIFGFSDVGAAPDYSQAPPVEADLFGAASARPAAVGSYQQRRLFASSADAPEKVWGSRSGIPSSFAQSTPLQDDDTIAFELAGNRVNVVKHLMDLARLLIFTTGSVLAVDGDQAGTLKPDAINPRKIARQGIGTLGPLEVDDSAIYVQARGSIVRSLVPVEAGGAFGGYRGSNLSVFATHLFTGRTIVDWAYAEEPMGIVWAVRDDGVMLGLTYLAEHAVWGWHRHDTDGLFKNACVVPEGGEDALYVVVRRTINGATVDYIERMHSRTFATVADASFVDAARGLVEGANASTTTMLISGAVAWLSTELLTLTASAGVFVAGDVGNAIDFIGADGLLLRFTLEGYTSATVMTGHVSRTVPADLRGVATAAWSKAVNGVDGLDHLEGKAVSVLADGFVVASPNNPAYAKLVVSGGAIALPHPYVKILVGLPFISDLETLDLDVVGRTIKDKPMLVAKVGVSLEASRGVWAGRPDKPTAALPLNGLQEMKPRSNENYDDPPDLVTDYKEITIDNSWDRTGRILVRQVDPLPLTVLSVTPIGFIAG